MKNDPIEFISSVVTALFNGTLAVLLIGSFLLFFRGRDAAFKRKWFPRFNVLVGSQFVFFATTLPVLSSRWARGLASLIVVVPMIILISHINFRFTKFCNICGATIYNLGWPSPARFCPKCGAGLDEKPKSYDDFLS